MNQNEYAGNGQQQQQSQIINKHVWGKKENNNGLMGCDKSIVWCICWMFIGGVPSRPGSKICPCFTSRSRRAPSRTRPSSSSSNNNKSSWSNSSNNNNSDAFPRPAGWRTTVVAAPTAVANSCPSTTNRTTRTGRTAWPWRPGPRWGASSAGLTSSRRNSLNFARKFPKTKKISLSHKWWWWWWRLLARGIFIHTSIFVVCVSVAFIQRLWMKAPSQTSKQTKKEEESERKHVHLIR